MEIFGKYLTRHGVISRAQLDEATQSQVVFGGRLGTNLVELGYLSISELEQHLSGHLDISAPPSHWLERPSDEALRAVPVSLVEKHGILPLAVEKRTLHLAMLDPRDPSQIDDIAFATGLRIQPYVMAEVRLTALLEHHFGIRRDLRYIYLGQEEARGRASAKRAENPDAARGEASTRRGDEAGIHSLEPPRELIDEATFAALHESGQRSEPEPEPAAQHAAVSGESTHISVDRGAALTVVPNAEPVVCTDSGSLFPTARVADLEARLESAADRDSVGRLALRIALFYASAAVLFVVRGGMVSGFLGDGEAANAQLDGILIPSTLDSVFARPATTQTPFRGEPPRYGVDARLMGALARGDAREILVHPILIQGRVVNLLYADNGPQPLGQTSLAALGALCNCISRAYERLILQRKNQTA